MMEVVVTTGAGNSSQIVTNNKPTPNFLQAGCSSCRPTNSVRAPKGNHKYTVSPKIGYTEISLTSRTNCWYALL